MHFSFWSWIQLMNPEVIENEGKDCSGDYIDDAVLFQQHRCHDDGDDIELELGVANQG